MWITVDTRKITQSNIIPVVRLRFSTENCIARPIHAIDLPSLAPLLLDFITISQRPPRCGILYPPIDLGLIPSGAVDADPDLRRERALGDLAIHGRAGQAGPGEDGSAADDAIGFGHGGLPPAGCFWSLLRQDRTVDDERARLKRLA